jgi:uncharacterized membrane protein
VLWRCSFLTFPNALKQCTLALPIIHSAINKTLLEKLPDYSNNPGVGVFHSDEPLHE